MPKQIFGIFLADNQTAINPEPDAGNVAERLDMDVAGSGLQRGMQDMVTEFRHQLVIIQRKAGAFRLAADTGLLLLFFSAESRTDFTRSWPRRFSKLVSVMSWNSILKFETDFSWLAKSLWSDRQCRCEGTAVRRQREWHDARR